jgi:thymidylate synthase (FAD)
MEVQVLRKTERPERLVCQAARGDYFYDYVGDTEYAELMKGVEISDTVREELLGGIEPVSVEDVPSTSPDEDNHITHEEIVEAKTCSFIQKQLSRGHYGPWEHPSITFAVKGVSRVTMAQITRHRHLTFDIQSMRYVDFSEQEIVTPLSLRDAEHFSRETGLVDVEDDDREDLESMYDNHVEQTVELYEQMVDAGIPKEDARFILPLGTIVNMTFSGNARTFLHLLDMRRKANAQWEIRELSESLLDELFEWMPYTFEYYEENGPNKLSP